MAQDYVDVVFPHNMGKTIKLGQLEAGKYDIVLNPTQFKVNDTDGSISFLNSSLPNFATKNSSIGDVTITNPDGSKVELLVPRIRIMANGNWSIDGVDTGQTSRGEKGEQGVQGVSGLSAYEIWRNQAGNGSKTEQDFLQAIKGEKGNTGEKGETGATGKTGATGETGKAGRDGTNGKDGKSAYQIWLDLGNTGTEQDFINALKGAKGDTGANGQNGQDGRDGEINLTLSTSTPTTNEDGTIPTTYVGKQGYILGEPDKFIEYEIDGDTYLIPAFLKKKTNS